MQSIKSNHGFSLLEVLAVTVLFSIITLISFSIITSSTNQQIKQSIQNRDIHKLSYTLKIITKDIRRSDTILPPEIDDTTSPETIYYKLKLDNNDVATYWLKNNEIIRSTPSSHNESIATNISEFVINYGSIFITTVDGHTINTDISLRSGKNETLN